MSQRALKDLPLQELTLRKYEEPHSIEGRELVKKFLLSLGLLQPGESRDILVDIMHSLLLARSEKNSLKIEDFQKLLETKPGASAPNIRRQLRRLKELKLVEHKYDGYRITEFGAVRPIISDFVEQFLVGPTLERIKSYADKLDLISAED